MENSKVYAPKEVAQLLGVKRGTVWKWIREGKLKAFHAGGLYRISQEDLDAFKRGGKDELTDNT